MKAKRTTTLIRILVLSVGVALALSGVVPLLPFNGSVKRGLLIALIGVFFMSVGRVPGTFFQVNLRMGYSAVLDVLYRVVALGLVGAAVALDLGFYAIVSAAAAGSAVWAISSFVLSRSFWSITSLSTWYTAVGIREPPGEPMTRNRRPARSVTTNSKPSLVGSKNKP